MRAGFAKAQISPDPGVRMFGFAGRDLEKPSTGVHDDIFVRACYLQQGDEQALILAFDLLFLGEAEVAQFREVISAELGLEARQVLMNTSHSHAGPRIGTWAWAGYTPSETAYIARVQAAMLQAAKAARDGAREVTIHAGATTSAIPMSRRKIDERGRAQWAPSPAGRVCRHLPYCLLEDEQGRPVCLLFSISCHPSMIGDWEVSAEYPGAACRYLDEHLGAECSLFLQGTGGDAKPSLVGDGEGWRSGTWEEVEQVGRQAADEVIGGLQADLHAVTPDLRCELEVLQWPLRPALDEAGFAAVANAPEEGEQRRRWAERNLEVLRRGEALPTSFPIAVQGLQLGEGLRMVAMQGEAVSGWGLFIVSQYQRGVTFPLGYTNGQGLYLPTSDTIPEGGYEVDSYHEYWVSSGLAEGFEEMLQATLQRFSAAGIR